MANSDLREDVLPKERLQSSWSNILVKGILAALMGAASLYALGYL